MTTISPEKINIFWFRRDLRLDDNTGLHFALKDHIPVLPIFIFDTDILNELENPKDPRVEFIHQQVSNLHEKLKGSFSIKKGIPLQVFKEILDKFDVKAVYTNHDYEPYAIQRDQRIKDFLQEKNIPFYTFKDQVIFEKSEIISPSGTPYKVYTPYKNKWLEQFQLESSTHTHPINLNGISYDKKFNLPDLNDLGFSKSGMEIPSSEIKEDIITHYSANRDFPSRTGTSRMGIHLRFGTISIRFLTRLAAGLNIIFLEELIWREFYMMILYHYPQVVNKAFKPQYDNIQWKNDEEDFEAWCTSKTGYPLVDAGMRELNATGFMHNRVRMVVASFLTRHLLIDWRWGEAYFAQKLLDYELASNNGGWQWAAGTGTDAQPYFRIFNPTLQAEKFDKDRIYIKKWIPEINTPDYPLPIIDHKMARARAIEAYKKALQG